ncbi:hypothetical protein M080_8130, partial [Bacteroides fragilis str. 3397 T10]
HASDLRLELYLHIIHRKIMMGYQGYKWNINSLVSNHDFF